MWIVRLALRRPFTIAVMALLILVLGVLACTRMIVDIFPNVDTPVVAVVWNYPGLPAEDMERRVVLISERAYSTSVNGIERIESQSVPGIGLLRIYFQPGTEMGSAVAQIAATSSSLLRNAPPGMQPPVVLPFNASNVPVAQLTVSSETLGEEKLFDYGFNFIRVRLFTIPGMSLPAPFGGKTRQITIDCDPSALGARGLSPSDIVTTLQNQNIIVPAGTARIGKREYNITLNSSPTAVSQFASIPVKVVSGAPVLLGDVCRAVDSFADQTNIVRVNGKRATYIAILKHADASTLAVVDAAREALPSIKAVAPQGMDLKIDFDQSIFVRGALHGVLREAIIVSALVSLMILIFLGSWRSTVIVCTSIPLAILVSVIGLKLTGNSINVMTLGGLALAIGMLVDDATVEVENIHRNLALGKPLTVAILDGARQIAVPAIVATLAICIVFFPVVLLVGPARFLFTPLALSVVFAMLASYVLSRTLVPALCRKLMHNEAGHGGPPPRYHYLRRGLIARFSAAFNDRRDRAFERFQDAYGSVLGLVLRHRVFVLILSGLSFLTAIALVLVIGTDFFPTADAGIMRLHVRAPSGLRIEETEQLVGRVEGRIRDIIPKDELETLNDMIGIPVPINLAYVRTDNIGGMDAEILVALKPQHHATADYVRRIRRILPEEFPGVSFYFQSADIVNQVLNFGLTSPIDVQIESPDFNSTLPIARKLRDDLAQVPGTADVHIKQVLDYPTLHFDVDRVRSAQLGLTQRDVTNSILISLTSSSLISPSFFLNPANNVNYSVAVKVPQSQLNSVQGLSQVPLTGALAQPAQGTPFGQGGDVTGLQDAQVGNLTPGAGVPQPGAQVLGNVATVTSRAVPNEISHYTVQRVLDIAANVDGRDLGSTVRDIQRKIDALGKLPAGTKITIRGQNEVMNASFRSLGLGLILAILLVYLLMVVLFQSWLDPLIIMVAVPGALVGILWMLALTGTTFNVESLMGAIMAVGIAVSNSILLISFANDVRVEDESKSALDAAREAGQTRLRPVLMTALAMILGMLPMALGLGEAGEQNAPLGRAVIGGLLCATFVTLFIVPVVYALLRKELPTKHLLEKHFAAEERGEIMSALPDDETIPGVALDLLRKMRHRRPVTPDDEDTIPGIDWH